MSILEALEVSYCCACVCKPPEKQSFQGMFAQPRAREQWSVKREFVEGFVEASQQAEDWLKN